MSYYTVIFAFLSRSYRDTVDLTWDESEFAKGTLSNSLLIEGSRQRKTSVSTAEAVHFRKSDISRKRNVIIGLFSYEPEKTSRSCTSLCDDEIYVILQPFLSPPLPEQHNMPQFQFIIPYFCKKINTNRKIYHILCVNYCEGNAYIILRTACRMPESGGGKLCAELREL